MSNELSFADLVEHDGKFLMPKPSPEQRYVIALAPGYYVAHVNWFRNGTSVITIKKSSAQTEEEYLDEQRRDLDEETYRGILQDGTKA